MNRTTIFAKFIAPTHRSCKNRKNRNSNINRRDARCLCRRSRSAGGGRAGGERPRGGSVIVLPVGAGDGDGGGRGGEWSVRRRSRRHRRGGRTREREAIIRDKVRFLLSLLSLGKSGRTHLSVWRDKYGVQIDPNQQVGKTNDITTGNPLDIFWNAKKNSTENLCVLCHIQMLHTNF